MNTFTVTGSPVLYGNETTLTFSATVTAANGETIPGTDTMTVTQGATTLCTMTVSSGSCSPASNTVLPASGTAYTVTATFNSAGADTNFVSTATKTTSVTVNKAAATDTVTSSLNPTATGAAVTYTATVTGGGATPTGSVTFKDGGTSITTCGSSGVVNLNGSGVATCTVTYLSTAGSPHSITAPYSGDTNYNSAASNTISETVDAAPTISSIAPNSEPKNGSYTGIVITGTGFVTGATVTFSGGGITVTSITVNSATKITINISIDPGASKSARDVVVTNTDGGQATLGGGFTVT